MKRLREWWAQRRYGPMTRDRCERCGRHLRVGQRVEISALFDSHDEIPSMGGQGQMTATYCRKDAP